MSTQQVYVSGKTAQLQSLPQHPKDLTIKLHRRQEKTAAQRSYSQFGGGRGHGNLHKASGEPVQPTHVLTGLHQLVSLSISQPRARFSKHSLRQEALTNPVPFIPAACYLTFPPIKISDVWQSTDNSFCLLILSVHFILKKFVENIYNLSSQVCIHQKIYMDRYLFFFFFKKKAHLKQLHMPGCGDEHL